MSFWQRFMMEHPAYFLAYLLVLALVMLGVVQALAGSPSRRDAKRKDAKRKDVEDDEDDEED